MRENEVTDLNREEQSDEVVTARIDIYSLTKDKKQNFTIEGLLPTGWMEKLGRFGYVIEKAGKVIDERISVLKDIMLTFSFKGPDLKDKNNNIIENWADFTKVSINGKDIISKITPVWHNKPYKYTIEAKKGDILNLHAEWKKHDGLQSKMDNYKQKQPEGKINTNKNITIINNGENIISLPENLRSKLSIYIYGKNNKISMDKVDWFEGEIHIGMPDCPVNDCSVEIGKGTTSNGVIIRILEDNSEVKIGNDCQFSWGITIYCSDTHTITDMDGNITNIGKYVNIGNHVWVGMNAVIGKNISIPDGCVVGMCSVVTSKQKFFPNSIIAGNPAKVVKEKIKWDRLRPKQYILQNSD